MANGGNEATTGILGYVLLVPLLLLIVGVPTIVLGAVATATLYGLQSTLGVPTPTFGLLGAVGLPPGLENSPVVYGFGIGVVTGLWLLRRTGTDWEGTDTDPTNPGDMR